MSLPDASSRAHIRFTVLAACLYAAFALLLMSSGFSNAVFRVARDTALKSRVFGADDRSKLTWKQSRVDRQSAPTWQWSATQLDKQSLKKIQVLDPNHAWIATDEGALYKTADSGISWARVSPQLPSQSYLTSISFVTPNVGRIALSRTSPQDDEADASWILSTNDGGKNWSQELSIDGAQVANILFADQSDGWATGRKFGYVAPQQDKDLILHTVDGGRSWKDLSGNLPAPGKGVNELYGVRQGAASVLTWNGAIFNTDDTGHTWRQIGTFRDDYEQTAVQRIGSTPSNGLWLLGGAASLEGTWSLLADKPVNGAWTAYRLEGIYLSDAVYLSENAIVACGFINSSDPVSSDGGREGVILYSQDRGQNWVTTYRDSSTASINSIAAADSNNIWAVGSNGVVLRLNKPDLARAATSTKSTTSAVSQTADDLNVYSTAVNALATRFGASRLMILDATTIGRVSPKSNPQEIQQFLRNRFPEGMAPELVDGFIADNLQSVALLKDFPSTVPHSLVQQQDPVATGDWEEFDKKNPGTAVVQLSRVGFNPATNQALVYVSSINGSRSGWGYYVFLTKNGQTWRVNHMQWAWAS